MNAHQVQLKSTYLALVYLKKIAPLGISFDEFWDCLLSAMGDDQPKCFTTPHEMLAIYHAIKLNWVFN